MNDHGSLAKKKFDYALRNLGGAVVLYRSGTSERHKGIKSAGETNPSKVKFQFAPGMDVRTGDVLQQEESRDLWEVYETEDVVVAGTLTHLNAWVHKKDGMLGRQTAATPNVLIKGDIVGGIQIAGQQSNQSMMLTLSQVHAEIAALRKLADEASDIELLDKEEIRAALHRIVELSKREKSENVTRRIKEKLDFVKVTMDVSEKAAAAGPYIAAILEKILNG